MKIVHVSTHDQMGGAARAAWRLHDGLLRSGEDSLMFTGHKTSRQITSLEFKPSSRPLDRLRRTLRREGRDRVARNAMVGRVHDGEPFSPAWTATGAEPLAQLPAADIYNLHWVAGLLDWPSMLGEMTKRAPVVWTLHDMNPFTGGCHYSGACPKFTHHCGACPKLRSTDQNDFSRKIWMAKNAVLEKIPVSRLRLAADSHWLADSAQSSSLFGRFTTQTMHYGLDVEVFQPRDGKSFRTALGIPESHFVILFAADSVDAPRKGFALLAHALSHLKATQPITLLSAGQGDPTSAAIHGLPHIHVGSLGSDLLLSLFYSAGDLFIIPSVQEAFGQTTLEAMSCGTPAIGFSTGGIPDIIRPGQTGQLAQAGDADDLAAQIRWMINHPAQRRAMRHAARAMVESEFTLAKQAARYQKLYAEMLQSASPTR